MPMCTALVHPILMFQPFVLVFVSQLEIWRCLYLLQAIGGKTFRDRTLRRQCRYASFVPCTWYDVDVRC